MSWYLTRIAHCAPRKPVRRLLYRYFERSQENRVSSDSSKSRCEYNFSRRSPRFSVKRLSASHSLVKSVSSPFDTGQTFQNLSAVGHQLTDRMPEKKQFERLPKNVAPIHYELFLKPNLKNASFEGQETIQIGINKPTSTIVLNSLELKIKSCVLTLKAGKSLKPVIKVNQEDETISLNFEEELPKGEADLAFEFTGELNDKMKGFYRSNASTLHSNLEWLFVLPKGLSYTVGYFTSKPTVGCGTLVIIAESSDGDQKYVAVTQFEPTDARRCFPCWDEPALKAVFEVTISAPKDKVVLSNMPCIHEKVDGDQKISKFSPTPVMSTYLVAVVVGDFDYVEDTSEDGVLVRVYTPPGVKEQGRFALYVATKVLPFYKDYFQIAYPLPKIDLVAIADFSAGAMENWGLVTYRQACLLVDPENTAASHKQLIAVVVGHELAHQWFGNLVTMEWWTHLWLNEGYASFVENLCVAHLFPEYNIWTQFVSDIFIKALELDCLKNSHPIEVPVGHPSEIDEIFDDISYNKGASVIRMLHRYIGDEDFKTGMHLYLTRHQYKNTFTEDLWAALEEASKKPVRAVMSTWTKQMGFPVIRVTSSEQEGCNRVLSVTQEKFVSDSSEPENNSLWMVPLTFSVKGKEDAVVHSEVLEGKSTKITIPDVPEDAWVKLNPGTNGVYRVQYPMNLLEQLIPAIEDKSLPPLDRLGIVDDLFALVKAGQASSVQVLKVLSAMRNEDNFTVWSIIANCMGKLGALISNTDYPEEFKKFGRYLFKPIGQKLGWEPKPNEGHMDTLLRSLVIGRLGWYGDEETIAEAKKRFNAHVAGECIIPADLRAAVYKSVLSVGDEDTFNTMIKLYREENLQEEKDRIGRALGAFQDKKILAKVLDFAMTDEVRSQDKVFVIVSVDMTKPGRELVWDFMRANWAELLHRYEGGFLLTRLVKSSMENFATEEMAVAVEEFFKNKECSAASRSIQQSVESIRLNAAWLSRDKDPIKEFLTSFKYD